ncbi:MAG: hypothetical protein WA584_12235 [Pyrinomonadaceae bacterium]
MEICFVNKYFSLIMRQIAGQAQKHARNKCLQRGTPISRAFLLYGEL